MSAHRTKQLQLIAELKSQLEDLEHYAYETGEAGMPQNLIVERQKVIIGNIFFLFFKEIASELPSYPIWNLFAEAIFLVTVLSSEFCSVKCKINFLTKNSDQVSFN